MVELDCKQFKDYFRSLRAVREQSAKVYERIINRKQNSNHFKVHEEKLDQCAQIVVNLMAKDYGMDPDNQSKINTKTIPVHSRLRHFDQESLQDVFTKDTSGAALIDLVMISVLLDAGVGGNWKWIDPNTNKQYSRSEGLAMATLAMFKDGLFSDQGQGSQVHQATAKALSSLKLSDLEQGFQIKPETNEVTGLGCRLAMLNRLGEGMQEFSINRVSGLVLTEIPLTKPTVEHLWTRVIMGPIMQIVWPDRPTAAHLDGLPLGDVWVYDQSLVVPFHKLSQWLAYSLIDALESTIDGLQFQGKEILTGLPEYRNGGLLIDTGVLESPESALTKVLSTDDDLVVEWRALTVVLLDKLADKIRNHPLVDDPDLALAFILEGGTWKAGRQTALQQRPPQGPPPLQISSDGTVF